MSIGNLPDPLPQKIALRFVGFRDPGFVLVTADGKKIDIIEDVYEEPGFAELCTEVEAMGYAKQPLSYADMSLLVISFEREKGPSECKASLSGDCAAAGIPADEEDEQQ